MRPSLTYKDICLVPRYSELTSRSEADTSVQIGERSFRLPVIPANMKSVISPQLSHTLSENGYFYVMHRFDVDIVKFCQTAMEKNWQTISISIGVQRSDYDIIGTLSNTGTRVDYITVDIAHGHCKMMRETIDIIKRHLPDTYIIAGNVATGEAVADLVKWGADMVKVGIGQGGACITKDKTGFTMPMFTCVESCAALSTQILGVDNVPIIADGGVQCTGDIAKALSAGATAVMAGTIFSACTDSPASTVIIDGTVHKQYFGSASEYNKSHNRNIEGVMKHIPSNKMSYESKLLEIEQDIQSSISYAGGKNVNSLRDVKYHIIK